MHNGWTNKETWLVNIWCMDSMPDYFSEMDMFHVEPEELAESVQYFTEESEATSNLKAGLLSDFISTCWCEVNWHELAEHLNESLKELESEQ